MNNLKKKVMASAAMLLVAAVMMTGSSFAWYTISTQGEMEQIKAELKATDNLEIAKAVDRASTPSEVAVGDEGDETKWGSDVTQWKDEKLDVPATATTSEPFVATVLYDDHGRVKSEMATLSDAYSSAYDNGTSKFTTTVNGKTVTGAVGYAVWLRSNNDLNDVTATVTGFDPTTTGYTIRYRKDTETNWTDYDDAIALTANVPTLVEVIVYMNGDNIHAEDVEAGITDDGILVVFSSAALTGEIGANDNNNAQK